MKMRGIVIVCLCLFTQRCATYYHLFSVEKSTYFSVKDAELLEKTTHAIDFDYGYDQVMDLDYVFPVTQGYTSYKDGEKELSRALEGIEPRTVVSFFEKIYRLKKFSELRMEKYSEDGDWKDYTYIQKYLLPPLVHYADVLEKQAVEAAIGTFPPKLKKERKI